MTVNYLQDVLGEKILEIWQKCSVRILYTGKYLTTLMTKLEKKLNCDLLFDVAEGLISKSDWFYFNIDTQAKMLKFMMVNKDCMSAFLSFFPKIKEVDICVQADVTEVEFYKSKSMQPILQWNEKETLEYQRPFRGDPWFLAFLVKNGKFNPKKISFKNFSANSDWQPLKPIDEQTTALQSLCRLLNLKGFTEFSPNRELCLDYLEISKVSGCSAQLPYYLALNAAEVKIYANLDKIDCFPSRPDVKAINTKLLDRECSIEFELPCYVEQEDLEKVSEGERSQHKLLQMGTIDQKQVNELEISRVIRLSETALIRFSISGSEDEENSDGYRDIIDDAFDDDDNYGEYDGEDDEDFDDYDIDE
uniref:Uncharacterized protein n=1 Tax=Ditylenchus dipsaci TaxID=166011 RepID=A0A915DGD0_9BILA